MYTWKTALKMSSIVDPMLEFVNAYGTCYYSLNVTCATQKRKWFKDYQKLRVYFMNDSEVDFLGVVSSNLIRSVSLTRS